jgi:hypothetical protein
MAGDEDTPLTVAGRSEERRRAPLFSPGHQYERPWPEDRKRPRQAPWRLDLLHIKEQRPPISSHIRPGSQRQKDTDRREKCGEGT